MLGLDQVENNMAAVLILSLAIAEPLVAVLVKTLNHGLRVVDPAVGTRMRWQCGEVIGFEGLLALSGDAHRYFTLVRAGHGTRNF